jgi:hypothetical protein
MSSNGTIADDSAGILPLPDFVLHYDAWGRLVYTDTAGRSHVDVRPVRAFPITDPGHGISLCDKSGHELRWIDDLEQLPDPIRELLERDLAQRAFLPVLLRIIKVTNPVEPTEWEVETDRGRTSFVLNSDEDVHRLEDHRAMVVDAHGVRYLIPDTRALDATSRRILERYL